MSFNIHLTDVMGERSDSYKAIISSAESFQSTESLNTSLRNVLDLFIRTGHVLKNSVFRMGQALKRSELEKYVNDHTLIVSAIEKLNYFDVKAMDADTPSGMKGSYIDAVQFLNDTFKDLDTVTMVKTAQDAFNRMRTSVLRGEDIKAQADTLRDTMNVKKPMVDKACKQMKEIFGASGRSMKFADLFKSMEEFKRVKMLAIDTEKYLAQANELTSLSESLIGTVNDMTSLRDVKIATPISNTLAESAMMTARILDLYGTSAYNMMSVSHNLTLIYNRLYTKVK